MEELSITDVSSFVRLQFCGRHIAFKAGKAEKEVRGILKRFRVDADPTFEDAGLMAEELVERELEESGFTQVEAEDWESWLDKVRKAEKNLRIFARQVQIRGRVGAYSLRGRIDFVLLYWKDGEPVVRVLEIKASRKDRTHQYVQLALYALLAHDQPPLWSDRRTALEFLIVRVDRGTKELDDPMREVKSEERVLLEQAKKDVAALLAPDGVIASILDREDPFSLPYTLNARCDACIYNAVCLVKGAERDDIELIGLPSDASATLREAGWKTLTQIASAGPEDLKSAILLMETPIREEHLIAKARAKLAVQSPPQQRPQDSWPVMWLKDAGFGHLPLYLQHELPLLRIYLVVEPDLVEDRINAIAAHVTVGDTLLQSKGVYRFRGELVKEFGEYEKDQGTVILEMRKEPWTGRAEEDDKLEGELVARFFKKLVSVLQQYGEKQRQEALPLHFYVWSENEIKLLVEAALRSGAQTGGLLRALWHLMGLREGLEQLIFSSIETELRNRFALGFTSRSLVTVTSLAWKGPPFSWRVDGLDLRSLFRLGLFDFLGKVGGRFLEVRSRNYDSIPPLYWRIFWKREPGTAESVEGIDKMRSAAPHLSSYIKARTLALRWVEEKIKPKNKDIVKPPVVLRKLPNFALDTDSVIKTSLDFMRFEQQVRMSAWLASKTLPPGLRTLGGDAIIIKDIKIVSRRWNKAEIRAKILPYPEQAKLSDIEARVTFEEGEFIRVSRVHSPDTAQRLSSLIYDSFTAILKEIDWKGGVVQFDAISTNSDGHYVLPTFAPKEEEHSLAVVDKSPSDYVARTVDRVLSNVPKEHPINDWFDPLVPKVPPITAESDVLSKAKEFLAALKSLDLKLVPSQEKAILDSLTTRIFLLQGPPGTGKTQVTALAVLLWSQLLLPDGDSMAIVATTHNAVDTLLDRVKTLSVTVFQALRKVGHSWRKVSLVRIDSSQNRSKKADDRIPIYFATTSAYLKKHIRAPFLIVDEASMMLFPHFLAIASRIPLESHSWRIYMAGDHRQLHPIIQHRWEEEDRPGVQRYFPYLSSFEALIRMRRAIDDPDPRIRLATLDHSHRLPEDIRRLIQPLYQRDNIVLRGRRSEGLYKEGKDIWSAVWEGKEGVYLVVHNESSSRKRNPLEAEILLRILRAAPEYIKSSDVAVVTPFRAHRILLREKLTELVDRIDTVERLQGGERKVVFYTASASDPSALMELQDFLLDVNRTNVAFSRAKERLVIVVSRTLLDYLPPDRSQYEDAILWKELRSFCTREMGSGVVTMDGVDYVVRLYVPDRGIAAS